MQINSSKVRLSASHCFAFCLVVGYCLSFSGCRQSDLFVENGQPDSSEVASNEKIRIATFNVALNRSSANELMEELATGDSLKVKLVAEVIQRMRPDILVLNEFDFDEAGLGLKRFNENYLQVSQNKQKPIHYEFSFFGPVNTGVDSGMDINSNGKTGEPEDAFGFGRYPGQYGMAVLSKFKIEKERVRTFQNLLWNEMPNPWLPVNADGSAYYSDDILKGFRISSKSHWIVPVTIENQTLNLVCSHPTPPVFDQEEDRNGKRNHDEVRLLNDIISDEEYLVDDQGGMGGLPNDAMFVIAGDLNSDPVDGESTNGAIKKLLDHELVNSSKTPASQGAVEAASISGGANEQQQGDPAQDTGDFDDRRPGNLRADYVLPSKTLELIDCGVFWPKLEEETNYLNSASDHHLVWIDVNIKTK